MNISVRLLRVPARMNVPEVLGSNPNARHQFNGVCSSVGRAPDPGWYSHFVSSAVLGTLEVVGSNPSTPHSVLSRRHFQLSQERRKRARESSLATPIYSSESTAIDTRLKIRSTNLGYRFTAALFDHKLN